MRDTMLFWGLALGCALLFILCDGLSAHWAKTGARHGVGWVVLLAPAAYVLFALVVERRELALGGALINTLAVVGSVLVGAVLFKEQISLGQYCGIGLAIMSITLINVG